MTTATAAPPARSVSSLAVALDLDDSVAALRLARELQPWFGVAKVGLELYSAAGPDVVGALMDLGYEVFCDLKFHDIPTTVGRAARVIGALGATYLNFHAQGGAAMLSAGVDGFLAGAAERRAAGAHPARRHRCSRATTEAPADILAEAGAGSPRGRLQGIVCAAADVHEAKQLRARPDRRRARHPPGGHARARPGPCRDPGRRPWPPAPTCSSSAGPSRRRTIPRRPRRPLAESIDPIARTRAHVPTGR